MLRLAIHSRMELSARSVYGRIGTFVVSFELCGASVMAEKLFVIICDAFDASLTGRIASVGSS